MVSEELGGEDGSVPAHGRLRRTRSTGFPVVSLAEAAAIIREAGKYGFEHSVSAFARYMGHTTTNSGAFRQRLAAFRDWKLIAGRGDTIVFTDTAKTIALPPDTQAEQEALRTAFMNCDVFSSLYEGVAKGHALLVTNLAARAVHDIKVSPTAASRFTTSFIESAIVAGLAERDGEHVVLRELSDISEPVPDDDGTDSSSTSRAEVSRSWARLTQAPPVVHQEWSVPAGTVVFEIRLDRPLPGPVFAQIGAIVQEVEALAARLAELTTETTA